MNDQSDDTSATPDGGASRETSLGVVVGAMGATTTGILPVWLIGALAVQMRADIGFTEFQLGIATSLFFGVSAITSIPASQQVERFGWRRCALTTAGLSSLALLLIAAFAHTYAWLLVFVALAALANALAQPSANLGLARGIVPGRQGLAFGLKQSSIPLATMLSGTAVPVIAVTLGWRWAFVTGASLGLALLTLLRPGPRTPAAFRRSRTPLGGPGDAPVKVLVILAVAFGFGSAATNAMGTFIVSYAVEEGISPSAAGWLFAASSGTGLAVRILSGWLADRRGRRHLVFCAALMLAGAVGMGTLAGASTAPLITVGALLGFGLGWAWNGVFMYAVVKMNRGAPATATGVTMSAIFIGGTTGPLAFGAIVTNTSYTVAWSLAAAAMAVAATFVLLGRYHLHRARRLEASAS